MVLLKKLFGAFLFIFAGLPCLLGGVVVIFVQSNLVSGLIAFFSGLLLLSVAKRLWNSQGSGRFNRKIAETRKQFGGNGRFEIPQNIEVPVVLMKYRRTGNFTVPMFRQSVRLWKGASISVRSGHILAPKDWVNEESGILKLTPKHLIYVGERSNKKMTWASIVTVSGDMGVIEVQQSNRGAMRWEGKGLKPQFLAAAELLWQATSAELVSVDRV